MTCPSSFGIQLRILFLNLLSERSERTLHSCQLRFPIYIYIDIIMFANVCVSYMGFLRIPRKFHRNNTSFYVCESVILCLYAHVHWQIENKMAEGFKFPQRVLSETVTQTREPSCSDPRGSTKNPSVSTDSSRKSGIVIRFSAPRLQYRLCIKHLGKCTYT